MPFEQFIINLAKDKHYFATKFGESNWLDFEGTIKAWKKEVLESRRNDYIPAVDARLIWREIFEIEHEDTNLANALYKYNLLGFFDGMPPTNTGISPDFNQFFETAFLPFVEYLKTEIDNG